MGPGAEDSMADPIQALEKQLDDVRRAYDLYFLGIEKKLPRAQQAEMERAIRRFNPGKDSVARFRYTNLTLRLQTLQRMWERTIKAIEEGTYFRDIQRANRKEAEAGGPAAGRAPVAPERAARAAQRAEAVGDEAAAFLASLRGAPKGDGPGGLPMRGSPRRGDDAVASTRPVAVSRPPVSRPPVSRPPVSRPPASRPPVSTPRPVPVGRAPTPAPGAVPRPPPPLPRPSPRSGAPAPAPPMRGAPRAPIPPRGAPAAPPMRGAPPAPPMRGAPPPAPPMRGTPRAPAPSMRGTPKGGWADGDGPPRGTPSRED